MLLSEVSRSNQRRSGSGYSRRSRENEEAARKSETPYGTLSDEEREELVKLSEKLAEEANAIRESAKRVLPYDLDKALAANTNNNWKNARES